MFGETDATVWTTAVQTPTQKYKIKTQTLWSTHSTSQSLLFINRVTTTTTTKATAEKNSL